MPTNKTQQMIRHKRKRSGVLVPLLEDLFHKPVEIDDEEDIDFLTGLLQRSMERQKDRTLAPKFSPSQLSECLRYVYLLKHHKALGITKQGLVRIEPNFYFFNGNFLHLKWQFALHKLHRKINDPRIFWLHGCEIPILSKHRDHGGTADALVRVYQEPYLVDFKGLNVRDFGKIAYGDVPEKYAIQIADYGMLWNSQIGKNARISKALMLTENKGGPDPKHPIALHESEIVIHTRLPDVRQRLEVLREHEAKEEIPEPECTSVNSYQFQGCPFRGYCKKEVSEIQRRIREADNSDSEGFEVARPTKGRDYRPGRNSKRR